MTAERSIIEFAAHCGRLIRILNVHGFGCFFNILGVSLWHGVTLLTASIGHIN
jgi:hypothetical protein